MTAAVLFVDDDPLLIASLRRTLRNEPYPRRFAASAAEALDILRSEPVAVLVTDDQMPGMPGAELIAAVHAEFPRVLPVLMSGQATVGGIVHALNHGQVFRVLLKPFPTEELQALIRVALVHQTVWSRCREALPILRRMGELLDRIDHGAQVGGRNAALEAHDTAADDVGGDLDELAAALDAELERARLRLAQRDPRPSPV